MAFGIQACWVLTAWQVRNVEWQRLYYTLENSRFNLYDKVREQKNQRGRVR